MVFFGPQLFLFSFPLFKTPVFLENKLDEDTHGKVPIQISLSQLVWFFPSLSWDRCETSFHCLSSAATGATLRPDDLCRWSRSTRPCGRQRRNPWTSSRTLEKTWTLQTFLLLEINLKMEVVNRIVRIGSTICCWMANTKFNLNFWNVSFWFNDKKIRLKKVEEKFYEGRPFSPKSFPFFLFPHQWT